MFVIVKRFEIEEAYKQNLLARLKAKNALIHFSKFIKREILTYQSKQNHSVIEMRIYFKDKKGYYQWEGSKEHILMHKQKTKKPQGLISVTHQQMTHLHEDNYEAL